MSSKPQPIVLQTGGEYNSEANEDTQVIKVKETISRIRKGLTTIQTQQQHDRHRLILHSESNKRSHSHVLQGSVIETACFIAASLFQIYFVRRWFAKRSTGGKA